MPLKPDVANVNIAVINESTVVQDVDVQLALKALQVQVSEHFAPVWGIDAALQFFPAGTTPPPGYWWLVILDNSDQAGALGYHDITDQGLPLGKVFAATDLIYKQQWTVTASHELLEMLGDPYINLAAMKFPGNNGTFMSLYAYEVCDACEADEYGYLIDTTVVSDFVYPTWFESFWERGSKQFDYQQKIHRPLELLPGGYISVYDVQFGQGWMQLAGPEASSKYASRAHVGSRRERRRISRDRWQKSRVTPASHRNSGGPLRGLKSLPVPGVARPVSIREPFSGPSYISVAREKQALRDQVSRDRAQRHADYLQRVQNPTEPPIRTQQAAAGQIRTRRVARLAPTSPAGLSPAPGVTPIARPGPTPSPAAMMTAASGAAVASLRILAEGDSWFDYPLPLFRGDGVIYQLQKLLGYPIDNMAHAGEEVRQMLGLVQRQEIISRLVDPNIRYDAMLFSGGGNDLVGDQLITLFKDSGPVPPPDQMLDASAVDAAMELLEAEYRELIAIRDLHSPGTVLFVNCYDFPPITGIPVCGHGPWLRPSLDYAYQQMGVQKPDPHVQFVVIQTLLTQFANVLRGLAADPEVQDFHVVETQGTLVADAPDWQNEIHPTSAGFVKIAKKFEDALAAEFP